MRFPLGRSDSAGRSVGGAIEELARAAATLLPSSSYQTRQAVFLTVVGRSVLCTVLDDSETRARVSGLPFGCLILPLSGVWTVEPQLDGWKTGTGARTETTTTTVSARTDPFRGLVFLFGIFLPKTGSQPGVIHWE